MIMELQKNSGAMTAQLKAIADQLEKMERRQAETEGKVEGKMETLTVSIRDVETKITVVSRVGYVVTSLAIILVGVVWSASQDTVKDIAKTAINSTIASAAKSEERSTRSPTDPATQPSK